MADHGIDGYTIPPPEVVNDGYNTDLLPYTGYRSPYLHIAGGPRPPLLGERPILSAYGRQEDVAMEYYDDNPLVVGNPFLDDPWEPHPFVRRRPQSDLPPWDPKYEPQTIDSASVPFRQSDPYGMPFHPSNPSLVPEPLRVPVQQKPLVPMSRRRSHTYSGTFKPITYPERWEWEMHERDVGDFYAVPYENVRPATPPRHSGCSFSRRHTQGGSSSGERSSRKKNSKYYPPSTSETRHRPKPLVKSGIPKHLLPRGSRALEDPVRQKSSHRRREHVSGERSSKDGHQHWHHRHKHRHHRNTYYERRPHTNDETSHHELRPHTSSDTPCYEYQQLGGESETLSLRSRDSSSPSRWSFRREDGTSFFAPPLQPSRDTATGVTKRGKSASFNIGSRLSGWRDRWAAALKKDESVESFACVTARAIERDESLTRVLPSKKPR